MNLGEFLISWAAISGRRRWIEDRAKERGNSGRLQWFKEFAQIPPDTTDEDTTIRSYPRRFGTSSRGPG